MTIINPSLHSNAKRNHPTQTKTGAITVDFLKQVRPSPNNAKHRASKDFVKHEFYCLFFLLFIWQ